MQPLQTRPVLSTFMPSREHRQWAMFVHLSALIGLFVPFGQIIGPLVLWLVKREESKFVDDQGREAMNFNVTMLIASLVLVFLMLGLWLSIVGIPVALLLMFVAVALMLYGIIMPIVAAMRASEGKAFRYPATLRFFS